MTEDEAGKTRPPDEISGNGPERLLVHRIVRYAPSRLRDEWINIGVLLFDPQTGERRLRLIEEEEEYNRVRRLHPQADESLLRALRDHLESRFAAAAPSDGGAAPAGNGGNHSTYLATNGDHPRDWFRILESGTKRSATRCGWQIPRPRKRTIWIWNWPGCTTTAWRCRKGEDARVCLEAAPACEVTAPMFSTTPKSGTVWKNPCAPRSLRFPAIPCASPTATGGTAREALYTRCRSRARPRKPKPWHTPRNASRRTANSHGSLRR
jgi:hypothetical protein